MTRYQPLPLATVLAALALLLAVLVVVGRCLAPAVADVPAPPTPTLRVVVYDPTPRTAERAPTKTATAVPTENVLRPTITRVPPSPTHEPTDTPTPAPPTVERAPVQKG